MTVRKTDAAIAEMTVKQALGIREVAIAKGVSREQIDKGQRTLALALDAVRDGEDIIRAPKITAPEGGRIHILDNVPVVLDGDWELAINNAGPDTPADSDVRKVGHLFLPTGTGTRNCRLLLVNNAGASLDKAWAWAILYPQLGPTTPRHVFGIGKHKPHLHKEFGLNSMRIISTTSCSLSSDRQQACDVWWHDARREAGLYWVIGFGSSSDWYMFLYE